jgi:hypothetical protein
MCLNGLKMPWPSILFAALMACAILCAPGGAAAQGCALCYTQAAASGSHFIQALRSGILILAVPPLALLAAIAVLAWRKRDQFHSG